MPRLISDELYEDYKIIATNSSLKRFVEEYTLYTLLPEIDLSDSSGGDLNSIKGGFTTQPVYITWTNSNSKFYEEVTVKRYYESAQGHSLSSTYENIDEGDFFYLIGRYEIIVTNSLGARSVTQFIIRETDTITYSIFAELDNYYSGLLTPSPEKIAHFGVLIEEYFTIYDYIIDLNPDKNLKFVNPETDEILEQENLFDNLEVGTVYYKILAEGSFNYSKMFAVTKVANSSDFMDAQLIINDHITATGNSYKTIETPTNLSWPMFNSNVGNTIFVDYYYNGIFVNTLQEVNSIDLTESGVYTFYFTDLAGNTQLFGNYNNYEILLINNVLFSINDTSPIEDAMFNEEVYLKIEKQDEYDYRTLFITATLNGQSISLNKSGDYYEFDDYGYYQILMAAEINDTEISSEYSFTITSKNQARLSFDYNPRTGYEITTIYKDGVDVTSRFKEDYESSTLTRLFLSPAEGGIGRYEISVTAIYEGLRPSQNFSFETWINDEQPMIVSSLDEGQITTDKIILQFNKKLIYQQIGECVIRINNYTSVTINETTAQVDEVTNLSLDQNTDYLVQLQTLTGNTILSFKVTKKAPLNSVAIFIIVAVSIIVSFLLLMFLRLRTRMKVS